VLAGFPVEQDADRLRFAHALVQETLYRDNSPPPGHLSTPPGDITRPGATSGRAEAIAEKAGSARWAIAARDALRALGSQRDRRRRLTTKRTRYRPDLRRHIHLMCELSQKRATLPRIFIG
jgi:hypothetical protein